jgi:hypothetical protein
VKRNGVISFVSLISGISFLLLVLLSDAANAQRDTNAGKGFLIGLSYAAQLPGGNLSQVFGFNSNVQGGVYYKTSSNLIFGVEGAFLFGNIIKNGGIFDSIATPDGNIIANNGNYTQITYFERGFDIQLTIGKLFPTSKSNLNSGILTTFSAGYFQHHIDIETNQQWAPQITGDYLNGYDQLTAGACATEFLGYMYISRHELITCFAGLEFTEGFTKSLRFDFNTKEKSPNLQYDILYSIRVGWVLPILKEPATQFYYY